MQSEVKKQLIIAYSFLGVLVVCAVITKYIVLGGLLPTTLKPAPPLSGVIGPSLANLAVGGSIPVEGKDYNIKTVRYFSSRTYAVVLVGSLKITTDPGVLVLQKLNGNYRVILGPGTSFQQNQIQGLPDNVTEYLQTKVLIYVPND